MVENERGRTGKPISQKWKESEKEAIMSQSATRLAIAWQEIEREGRRKSEGTCEYLSKGAVAQVFNVFEVLLKSRLRFHRVGKSCVENHRGTQQAVVLIIDERWLIS